MSLESAELKACRIRSNALDHRAHAIRALRREMLLKSERAKSRDRIHGQNLLRRPVGKKCNRNGDQPSHQVRVAVPAVVQDPFAFDVRFRLAFEPNLADAASHFGDVVVGRLAQRLEGVTQFDDIAIPVLPIVERGEVVAYGVDRRQGMREPRCVVHRPYMGFSERSASASFRIHESVGFGKTIVMKRKPYAKDRRMALWLRKQPDSRLKIDLISGCNFKGTRDGPERFYVIRPHPFAVPPGSVMSANRYAAVPRQQPTHRGGHCVLWCCKGETESNGALLSGEKTWN
jgi:hypothetical protein